VQPNWKRKPVNVSEEEYLAQIADKTVGGDPTLQGLPAFDMDTAALPTRERLDGQGDAVFCRNAWRRIGNALVIRENELPPNWAALLARLRNQFPASRRLELAVEFAALREAVETRDTALLQLAAAQIITKGTPAEGAALRLTLREKNIPVTV